MEKYNLHRSVGQINTIYYKTNTVHKLSNLIKDKLDIICWFQILRYTILFPLAYFFYKSTQGLSDLTVPPNDDVVLFKVNEENPTRLLLERDIPLNAKDFIFLSK